MKKMPIMQKIITFAIVISLIIGCTSNVYASFSYRSNSPGSNTSTISLNKKTATIYTAGNYKTLQLKATVKGQTKKVAWKSSNPSVASVDKNGKVTAKKVGTVIITASTNGANCSCKIIVKLSSIQLNKNTLSLKIGQNYTLKPIVKGYSSNVTWKSSNPLVATVNKSGKVTAKKAGSTIITASTNGISAKCAIKVSVTTYNIYGTWEIDSTMTMSKNKVSMFQLFGTGYKYGNNMTINRNGSFSYFIGIGNGGKGTYSYKNNKISYSIKRYEDGYPSNGTMSVTKISGKLYIIQNCKDIFDVTSYKLYWIKKK